MSDRSVRAVMLGAGSLSAIGLGLVAYRWFVLGFSWGGDRSSLMSMLGAGAMVAGGQGVRRMAAHKVVRTRLLAAVVLPGLAIGAAIGFAIAPPLGYVALIDRDLGAFTIALPDDDQPPTAPIYAAGSVRVDRIGGFAASVMVKWEPGGLLEADQLAMIAKALAGEIGGAAMEPVQLDVPGGLSGQSLTLHDQDMWITVVECGSHRVALFSRGGGRGLHQRLLGTVRCHPDPARESGAGDVPVFVDLPPDWRGQTMTPGQVGFGGAGDEAAIVQVLAGTLDEHAIAKLLPKLVSAAGAEATLGDSSVASGPAGPRTLHKITLRMGQDDLAGLMTAWGCPDRGVYLVAMYLHARGGDDARARDFLLRARCARADEKVPEYPAAP